MDTELFPAPKQGMTWKVGTCSRGWSQGGGRHRRRWERGREGRAGRCHSHLCSCLWTQDHVNSSITYILLLPSTLQPAAWCLCSRLQIIYNYTGLLLRSTAKIQQIQIHANTCGTDSLPNPSEGRERIPKEKNGICKSSLKSPTAWDRWTSMCISRMVDGHWSIVNKSVSNKQFPVRLVD